VQEFPNARPFPHFVSDDSSLAPLLRRAAAEFDSIPPERWVRYDSPDERGKRAYNDLARMPPACRLCLDALLHDAVVDLAERVSGLEGLQADPSLYGAGLHVTEPGGFLGVHVDNELHPATGLVRRLNLIAYLTPDWRDEWGGELELWAPDLSQAVARIVPRFGREVLMECGPRTYHGHPRPLACPPDVTRKSFSVFFWSAPRARARFVGPAGAAADPEVERWRRDRSRAP